MRLARLICRRLRQTEQPYASTAGALPPLRDGYFPPLSCCGGLDAPEYLPSGGTVAVLLPQARQYIVMGGLAYRSAHE